MVGRDDRPPDGDRVDGYAALRDYAAIGDGRTLALVACDGSIDWLCTPEFDGESMLGALLDAERGGAATLQPDCPYAVDRRYLADTNVLETTFTTSLGVVRVTDAMVMDDAGGSRLRTLLRRVECLSGSVPVAWSVAPRFGYGQVSPAVAPAGDGAMLSDATQHARVHAFGLGDSQLGDEGIQGRAELVLGDRGLLAIVIGGEPPPDRQRDAF